MQKPFRVPDPLTVCLCLQYNYNVELLPDCTAEGGCQLCLHYGHNVESPSDTIAVSLRLQYGHNVDPELTVQPGGGR